MSNSNNEVKKNKTNGLTKKKATVVIVSLSALLVVLAILNTVDFDGIIALMFKKDHQKPQYDYFFYDPDYETDILTDPEYLELDRTVSYTEGALTYIAAELDNYNGTPIIKKYLNEMENPHDRS